MNYPAPIKKEWAKIWFKEYILETCEKEILEINKKIEEAARKGLQEIEYKHYISKTPIYSLINLYIENGFKVSYIEGEDGVDSERWREEYLRIFFQW